MMPPDQLTRYKKNAFRSFAEDAYIPKFIGQLKQEITYFTLGEWEKSRMVRQDKRSLTFKLIIGLGPKNEYVQNDYHPKGEYCDFETIEGLLVALHVLLREAKGGVYDDALRALLKKRQDHAWMMVNARAAKRDKKGTFASPEKEEE